MVNEVQANIEGFRMDLASSALYEFIWNEYCDWYLEFSKPALQSGNEQQRNATLYTLLKVLETTLRALHPFMPFITEEIWQRLREPLGISGNSIMLEPWPAENRPVDPEPEISVGWIKSILQGIRRIRSELDLAPSLMLKVELQSGTESDRAFLAQFESLLISLGRVESFNWIDDQADTSKSAVAPVGSLKLLIPLAGLVDVQAEMVRIEKLIAREESDLKKSKAKVGNKKFVENAPPHVVEQEKERLARHEAKLQQFNSQLQQLESLKD
jgi:valyl-tRNA synthetase